MDKTNRRWGTPTKRFVAGGIVVLLALVLYRFQDVIPPLVIALLLAFILDPIVDFLTDRLHLARGLATGIVFLVLIIGALGLIAAPVPFLQDLQAILESIVEVLTDTVYQAGNLFSGSLVIGEYELDLSSLYEEFSSMVTTFIRSVVEGTLDIALNIASGAFWLIFILFAAFYLVKDADRLVEQINGLAPPGYRDDFLRLLAQVQAVWNAFLRGQLLVALGAMLITTVLLSAVGVPFAWVMGILAGVMAFVPNIGPVIAAVPPILVAFFQGSDFLPLENIWFAVLVAGLYIISMQLYYNIFAPRIMGRSLNLHPLVMLIAFVIGGQLAGILGMLLAAPILATLRIIGNYVLCRLYDRDPFAEPQVKQVAKKGLSQRIYEALSNRLRRKHKEGDAEPLREERDPLA